MHFFQAVKSDLKSTRFGGEAFPCEMGENYISVQ